MEYSYDRRSDTIHISGGTKTLYHIGPRPPRPKPSRDPRGGWLRKWLPGGKSREPVVFMTDDWEEVASFHYVRGNVYAYKIPWAAIKESGGLHKYDKAKEVLIPESVWDKYNLSRALIGKVADLKTLGEALDTHGKIRTEQRYEKWKDVYGQP
jgi:hypothetical protein